MQSIAIGICDDEIQVAKYLKDLICSITDDQRYVQNIQIFNSGEDLLRDIKKIDLVFLDIDMPGMDGIAVGKEIKKIHQDCQIIMETGRKERFKEAFQIRALRFVTKPFQIQEIREALDAYRETYLGEACIEAFRDRQIYQIKQKDIMYIYAMDSYTEIVIEECTLRTEESMKELEEKLDSRLFYRVHKQFIVNMSKIDRIDKNTVMIAGKKLPVSRRKKAEFENRYLEYDMKYR